MRQHTTLLITLTLCIAGPFIRAEDTINAKQRGRIQGSTGELLDELERLQDDIVVELSGEKQRKLYSRTDKMMSKLNHIFRKLSSQMSRAQIYKQFDLVDEQIHQLLEDSRQVENKGIKQSARRVYFADLELHYQIALGDTSAKRKLDVVRRQIEAFVDSVERLQATAILAIPRATPVEFRKLTRLATDFQTKAKRAVTVEGAVKEFKSVDIGWGKLVNVINGLPPRENSHFLRSAVRLDRLHKRLFQLLQMKGKRKVLTVQI